MIVDPYFLDHPKTRVIVAKLGRDEKAPLYLLRLWGYCQITKKTCIENDADLLATICQYKGHADVLLDAMVTSKWLDANENGSLEVHGFAEWNRGMIVLRENIKRATAARMAKHKTENKAVNKTDNKAVVVSEHRTGNGLRGEVEWSGVENTPKPPEGACVGWVSEFVSALLATGKTPAVTAEQVLLVHRDHPGAKLPEKWPDVVTEITGLAAPAQNTVQVLRRALSRIEMRLTGGFQDGRGNKNKEEGSSQSDGWPDQPEWMKDAGAK
jgi:hypothetical protein